eukprot:UN00988
MTQNGRLPQSGPVKKTTHMLWACILEKISGYPIFVLHMWDL